MKAKTRDSVEWLTGLTIAMIIVAICIFVLGATLSTVNVGCWAVCLLEIVPLLVWGLSEDWITDYYHFSDFKDKKYKKKIIMYGGKYYRAYNFWGIYLREDYGFDSVQALMEKFPEENEKKEECDVIGDL